MSFLGEYLIESIVWVLGAIIMITGGAPMWAFGLAVMMIPFRISATHVKQ